MPMFNQIVINRLTLLRWRIFYRMLSMVIHKTSGDSFRIDKPPGLEGYNAGVETVLD